jgi:GT2 family glycosyltransferase
MTALTPNSIPSITKSTHSYHIDAQGLLNDNLLIILGWAYHPSDISINFNLSTKSGQHIPIKVQRTTRRDVNRYFNEHNSNIKSGFVIIAKHASLFSKERVLKLKISDNFKEINTESISTFTAQHLSSLCLSWLRNDRVILMNILYKKVGDNLLHYAAQSNLLSVEKLRSRISWHWDYIVVVPGQGVFLNGWLLDTNKTIVAIYLRVNQDYYSTNILRTAVRYSRIDVDNTFPEQFSPGYNAGLYCWTQLPYINDNSSVEIVFITNTGEISFISIDYVVPYEDVTLPSQQILKHFHLEHKGLNNILKLHIAPALSALWTNRKNHLPKKNANFIQFGSAINKPNRSIIIPIYGRHDLLLHQISQFVKDPDIKDTELIYVLDDPTLYERFIPLCYDTSEIFDISFIVIYQGHNLGYAGANNLGVSFAKSDQLILLNSDVIPSQPGWISRIENHKNTLKDAAIVSPKLVFEDNTIQHIGLDFHKIPELGNNWFNFHPGKGKPEWLLDIKPISESVAVTGACMFISKRLYNLVGGLDESYILGDFEDSDLCLKLRRRGYKHYVIGSEKLFHLERQSQNISNNRDWKFKITLYNAWQHTERWGSVIELIKEQNISQ